MLLNLYEVEDYAMKVVGVGSVGTRCAVLLMRAGASDWSFAYRSRKQSSLSLSPTSGRASSGIMDKGWSRAKNVLMQSAQRPLPQGYVVSEGRDYYIRQLKDMKWAVSFQSIPRFVATQVCT